MSLYSTKMLYVFYVDLGVMLKLDINLAVQKALKLKEAICKYHNISIEKQVLLVSGGEVVDPHRNVSSYYAGSDASNPFFLFNRDALESTFKLPDIIPQSYRDFEEETKTLIAMPIALETVASRTKLAQNFEEADRELENVCRNLVHEEHLQHQGWSAVIANMEDAVQTYQSKVQIFLQNLEEFLSQSNYFQDIIERFPNSISLLKRVQIPQNLFPTSDSSNSLFDWIHLQDSKSSLAQLLEQCKDGLIQFTMNVKEAQTKELSRIVEEIVEDRKEMKKIGGLEERLRGLDKLLIYIAGIVSQQQELSQVFSNIQARTQNMNDTFMLRDICDNHKHSLEIMLRNHNRLIDAELKCRKTKYELCKNLNYRLKWVMLTQQSLLEVDNRLMMRLESLNGLTDKFKIARQVDECPKLFCQTSVEIFRRKKFSTYFKKYTDKIFKESEHLCDTEIERRKSFALVIEDHFLSYLFPGLEDLPAKFMIKPSETLDSRLPEISLEIINELRHSLPELHKYLEIEKDFCDIELEISAELNLSNHPTIKKEKNQELPKIEPIEPDNLTVDKIDFEAIKPEIKFEISESNMDGEKSSNYQSFLSKDLIQIDLNSAANEIDLNLDLNDDFQKFGEDEDIFVDAEILMDDILSSPPLMLQPFETIKDEEVDRAGRLQQQDFLTADFYIEESFSGSALNLPEKQFDFEISPSTSLPLKRKKDLEIIINDKLTKLKSSLNNLKLQTNDLFLELFTDLSINKSQINDHITLLINKILKSNDMQLSELQDKLNRSYDAKKQLEDVLEQRSLDIDRLIHSLNKMTMDCDQRLNSLAVDSGIELEKLKDAREIELKLKDEEIERLKKLLTEKCESLDMRQRDIHIDSIIQKFEQENKKFCDTFDCDFHTNDSRDSCKLFDSLINHFDGDFKSIYESINSQCLLLKNFDASEEYSTVILRELNLYSDYRKVHLLTLTSSYHSHLRKVISHFNKEMELIKIKLTELEAEKINIESGHKVELQQMREQLLDVNKKDIKEMEMFKEDWNRANDNDLSARKISSDIDFEMMKKEMKESHEGELLFIKKELSEKYEKDLEAFAIKSKKENDIYLEDARKTICQQKDEELSAATILIEEKFKLDVEALKSQLKEQQETELDLYRKEIEEKRDESDEALEIRLKKQFDESVASVRKHMQEEHDRTLETFQKKLEEECNLRVAEAKQEMQKKHETDVELLRMQLKDKFDSDTEQMQRQFDETIEAEVESAREECRDEMERMKKRMQEEAEAKNQILFNQALMSALKDKNKNIETLEKKLLDMQETLMTQSFNIPASHAQESGDSASKSMAKSLVTKQDQNPNQISFFEMALRHKHEENKRLRESLASSTINSQNQYISLNSCNDGDILLFVWDKDCGHYLANLKSPALKHFLHSDCLPILQLQDEVHKSHPKEWVLAVVISKELCQAKKATNRFNVPYGTKFYRIKVRPFIMHEFEATNSSSDNLVLTNVPPL